MNLKKLLTSVFCASFVTLSVADQATSPVGVWKTIDDETNTPKSLVEITKNSNGTYEGKVIDLFRTPEQEQNPICDKCTDHRKDQPIRGLTILWDLKERKSDWGDGRILDPNNGKTYNARIELVENGQQLQVRGFLGIALLGRTQVWHRHQ